MQPRHRVTRAALELVKRFEGYRQTAVRSPDGRWMIGHGHTLSARQGAQVSADDAEALLIYDLLNVGQVLTEAVFTPLNPNQFDALSSFVFNVGADNFRRSSVLKRLNEGSAIQAACALELWRKAEIGGEQIVVDALVRRRAAEKALFLTPPDGVWVPAPTPILRPLLDVDDSEIVPLEPPVEVTTTLDGDRVVIVREGQVTPPPVAPEEDDASENPARAAAEAVTARLSTLFQDEAPASEPEPEPKPEPEEEPPAPQAEFVHPPMSLSPKWLTDPPPFFLRAPDVEADTDDQDHEDHPWASRVETEDEGPRSGDLFDPVDDEETASEAEAGYGQGLRFGRERRLIDDSSHYEFEAPVVQPLPERTEGGALTLIALAVLGLIFFGGGVFWATYARPMAGSHLLGPRLVGGLAGVAGVGFFVVAVYLLLDRLGRAAEREARERP